MIIMFLLKLKSIMIKKFDLKSNIIKISSYLIGLIFFNSKISN